jgi:hypothetical protein
MPCSCRCSRGPINPTQVRSGRPSLRPSVPTVAEGAPSVWLRNSAIIRRPRSRECVGLVRWPARCSPRRRGLRRTGPGDGRDNPLPTPGHGDWPGHEARPRRQAEDPAQARLGGRPAGRPARPGRGPGQGAHPCPADRLIPEQPGSLGEEPVASERSAGHCHFRGGDRGCASGCGQASSGTGDTRRRIRTGHGDGRG